MHTSIQLLNETKKIFKEYIVLEKSKLANLETVKNVKNYGSHIHLDQIMQKEKKICLD